MAAAGEAATSAGGVDASMRLRSLCLSAAVGISNECDYALGILEATSSDSGDSQLNRSACDTDHAGGDDGVGGARDELYAAINGRGSSDPRATLGGCGEPLVRLLSRQALRIVSLYKNEPPASSLTPARSISTPSSASSDHVGMKTQQPDAVRTSFVNGGGRRQRTRGRRGDDGGPACHNEPLVLKRLDDLISISYTRFYAYLYKDLPLCWRQLYTDAAILKFSFLVLLFLSPPQNGRQQPGEMAGGNTSHATCLPPAGGHPRLGNTASTGVRLDEMVKTLDLALILAGAGGHARGRAWIDQAFVLLERTCIEADDTSITMPALNVAHRESVEGIAVTSPDDLQPSAKRLRLDANADPTADPTYCTASWGQQSSFSSHEPFTPPVRYPIRRTSVDVMDMPAFQRYLDSAPRGVGPEPLVLTGLADRWPARTDRPWAKPSYLLSRTFAGRRLVPVEIGRSYVDEGWGQKIVSFGEFLREYIDSSVFSTTSPVATEVEAEETADQAHPPVAQPPPPPPPPTAYLAQHQLLLQLPQLRTDVLVPDHCYTAPPPHPSDPLQDRPELDEPLLHAWLGPPGTITPLHTDPYHNLLVQVVGRKYVRLYAPRRDRDRRRGGDQSSGRGGGGDEGDEMRARGREGGVDMGNTSRWDVGVLEGWDARPDAEYESENEEKTDDEVERTDEEEFRRVPFVDCILEPGDTLYIPIGWWHYVRGLSVSFSVSIWWN